MQILTCYRDCLKIYKVRHKLSITGLIFGPVSQPQNAFFFHLHLEKMNVCTNNTKIAWTLLVSQPFLSYHYTCFSFTGFESSKFDLLSRLQY